MNLHSPAPRDIRQRVGEDEWQARVDLATAYRLSDHFGWTDIIYTHISLRVPGEPDHFLLNPFGLTFAEVLPDNLVKIDLDGRVVEDTPYTVNSAGFVIHSAVHGARPDLHCVVHLHTPACMSLSMLRAGLLPLSQHAMMFHNRIGYHDYEGIALNLSERERLIRDLGPHKALILRNHGALTAGATVGEAMLYMYYLNLAADTQLRAMAASDQLVVPGDDIAELTAQQHEGEPAAVGETSIAIEGGIEPVGAIEWQAWRRLIARKFPGFAD
jgi:ribulose-5-phosphate 4-epimerase/fuculose-1-phosphate aldolase